MEYISDTTTVVCGEGELNMSQLSTLRGLYEGRRLDDAWALYESAPAEGPEWHLYGALVAYRTGNQFAARTAAEKGLAGDPTGSILGRLRFVAGEVNRTIGDNAEAKRQIAAFLCDVGQYPELQPIWEPLAYYNLGLTHYQRREYADAIACYQKAIGGLRREGLRDYLRLAIQNLSWTLCLVGDVPDAVRVLEEAEDLCETEEARWKQRVGFAWIALNERDFDNARELAEDIVKSDEAPNDVKALACYIAGRCYLESGYSEQANLMGIAALDLAAAVGDSRVINLATELRRACYERLHGTGA